MGNDLAERGTPVELTRDRSRATGHGDLVETEQRSRLLVLGLDRTAVDIAGTGGLAG